TAGGGGGGGGGPGLAGGLLGGDYVLLERQLAVREEQVSALSSSLEAVQRGAADAASRHALELATLKDQLATTRMALERVEREVARRPEPKAHQELRRRVEALQSLVDVQMQAEGWSGEQVEATLRDPSAQSVTTVLQERSRKLSSEVNSLKRQLAERDKQIQDLEGQLKELESDLQRRAKLVAQLEEHLAAAAGAAASAAGGGAATVAATTAATIPLAAAGGAESRLDTVLLPQLSGSLGILPSGDLEAAPSTTSLTAATSGDAAVAASHGFGAAAAAAGGGSLLEIVVSQRDRFRQRMVQLEEEKSQLSDELHKTQQQLQSCRNDNVALFEKIRYLERYNQRAAAASRATVVRVDAAGVAQPSAEELAAARTNRYQCGPFALEVGGTRRGALDAAGTAGGAGGGLGAGGATKLGGGGSGGGIRSRGARRGGAGALACFGGDGDDVEAGGATPESRAARAYEARVNPFAEFQQSEAELRVRNLQVHDRALLAGSRLLLGSRVARMFLAIYTVMLHFIILLLFFYATTPCPVQGAQLDAAALASAMSAAAAATTGAGSSAASVPGTLATSALR
ncbi:hypothetical protein Vretifemale_14276, partial [Volvox reticuliferus]